MRFGKVPELPEDLAEIMTIDEDDLSSEFATFTAVYARWLYIRSDQQARILKKSNELSAVSAETRLRWSEELTKPTVDDLKARVTADPVVRKLNEQLARLEADAEVVKGIIEALRAKKDMLISLGAQQRALLGPLARGNDNIDLSER